MNMQKATLEKWVDELQAQIDALKKQIGGASKLDDLTDVDITEPANGNVIAYDGSAEKWVNAALPDYALDDLTDVEITEPANGNVIAYDGTTESWINTALSHYTLTELYKSSTDLATYSTSGIELLHDIEDYDRVLFILGFTSGKHLLSMTPPRLPILRRTHHRLHPLRTYL